jgi:hypothetical protein
MRPTNKEKTEDTDLSPCPATHLVDYCVGHRGGARVLVVFLGLNAQQEVVLVHPFLSDPNGLGLGRGGGGEGLEGMKATHKEMVSRRK